MRSGIVACSAAAVATLATACGGSRPARPPALQSQRRACPILASEAVPVGRAVATPDLSDLIRRSREHELRRFTFAQCFGTPEALTLTQSGRVSLSPILRASLSAASGLASIPVRIVRSTGYVDVSGLAQVPQIADMANHHRWLAFSVAPNLHQPLNELYPQEAVRVLASTPRARSIGQSHIDGTLVYGFEAAVDPAALDIADASRETLVVYLSSTGEPIRIVTSVKNNPGTAPPIARTLEEIRPATNPVELTPPSPSQTQPISYAQARAIMLVP